jgi:hypothetical protein
LREKLCMRGEGCKSLKSEDPTRPTQQNPNGRKNKDSDGNAWAKSLANRPCDKQHRTRLHRYDTIAYTLKTHGLAKRSSNVIENRVPRFRNQFCAEAGVEKSNPSPNKRLLTNLTGLKVYNCKRVELMRQRGLVSKAIQPRRCPHSMRAHHSP